MIGVLCVGLLLLPLPSAQSPKGIQAPLNATRAPATPTQSESKPMIDVVIPMPEPRSFQLALDEFELDWPMATEVARGERTPAAVPGTTIVSHDRTRTVVRVNAARSADALKQTLAAVLVANPEARGELVVYDAGRPQTDTTRRLLTSDVALLLEEGVVLQDVIAKIDGLDAKAVRGAPRGYVIRCTDPLAALDVAKALATIEGVKRAYPLLKRTRVTR